MSTTSAKIVLPADSGDEAGDKDTSTFTSSPKKKVQTARATKVNVKADRGTAGTPRKKAKSKSEGDAPGEWTPDKKATVMDHIIATGYKQADLHGLAKELGLNVKQIVNQFTPGRKGNFREKAIHAVRGEE